MATAPKLGQTALTPGAPPLKLAGFHTRAATLEKHISNLNDIRETPLLQVLDRVLHLFFRKNSRTWRRGVSPMSFKFEMFFSSVAAPSLKSSQI